MRSNPLLNGRSHLNHQRLSGWSSARDGLRRHFPLRSSLVVKHSASDGGASGEFDHPVPIKIVFTTKVLDSCKYLQYVSNTYKHYHHYYYSNSTILEKGGLSVYNGG